jgi:hypothetical protein
LSWAIARLRAPRRSPTSAAQDDSPLASSTVVLATGSEADDLHGEVARVGRTVPELAVAIASTHSSELRLLDHRIDTSTGGVNAFEAGISQTRYSSSYPSFLMSVLRSDPERGGFIKQAVEHLFPSIASKGRA